MSKNGEDIFGTREESLKMEIKPGYHIAPIKKGVFGESSKMREELDELIDAESQGCKLMVMIEAADLYGALREFVERRGYTMEDIVQLADITARAFKSGARAASETPQPHADLFAAFHMRKKVAVQDASAGTVYGYIVAISNMHAGVLVRVRVVGSEDRAFRVNEDYDFDPAQIKVFP